MKQKTQNVIFVNVFLKILVEHFKKNGYETKLISDYFENLTISISELAEAFIKIKASSFTDEDEKRLVNSIDDLIGFKKIMNTVQFEMLGYDTKETE